MRPWPAYRSPRPFRVLVLRRSQYLIDDDLDELVLQMTLELPSWTDDDDPNRTRISTSPFGRPIVYAKRYRQIVLTVDADWRVTVTTADGRTYRSGEDGPQDPPAV